MENSGMFIRQWKLRPIGPYHTSASPSHRKTAKNRTKKDWLNKENIIFFWLGRVSKTGRILSENERPQIFAENWRFPTKTGGLESLQIALYFKPPLLPRIDLGTRQSCLP